MSTNFEYQVKNKDTYKNTNKNTNNDIIPEIIKDKSEDKPEYKPKDINSYINQDINLDEHKIDSTESYELLHYASKWNNKLAEFSGLDNEERKIFIDKYKKLYKENYDYNEFQVYGEKLQNDSLVDGLLFMYIGKDFHVVAWLRENKYINQINMNYLTVPFSTGYMDGILWLENEKLINITNPYYLYVSSISGHLDVAKYVYDKNGQKINSIDSIFYMCCDNNKLNMVDWLINTINYKPSSKIVQELIKRAQYKNNLEMIKLLKTIKN